MSTLLARARHGEALTDLQIIDMHAHLGRPNFGIPDLSAASIVAQMDRLGVRSTVVSHIHCISTGIPEGNDELLQAMTAHPGRILGYATVWPSDPNTVENEIRRCLEMSELFVGIKLHNATGVQYDHPAYLPALAIAEERRLPVLFHTWGDPAEFSAIKQLADTHRNASLLLAHTGSANEEGYIQIARECPNVYLELAFSTCPRGLVQRLVDAVGAERVVWGSDVNFFSQAQQIGKVLGADIPDTAKQQILSGNAARLLKH